MNVLMVGLRKKRDELAAQARSLNEEIRSLRKRFAALPMRVLHVVWLLFALGASPQDAVLVILKPYAEGGHDDNALVALAEQSFLSADLQRIASLCDGSDPKALKLAKALLAEQALMQWCRQMNLEHKIAPSTAELLLRAQVFAFSCRKRVLSLKSFLVRRIVIVYQQLLRALVPTVVQLSGLGRGRCVGGNAGLHDLASLGQQTHYQH